MTDVVRLSRGPMLDAAVATLVAAHLDYEWERWAVRGDDRERRLADAYRSDLVDIAVPLGVVHATADASSVAVWMPAGADVADRPELEVALFGDHLDVVREIDALVSAAPCPAADWHLATMGTRPEAQGRGFGSMVLARQLGVLDRRTESARLDTSSPDNVRFYRRHHFDVVAELDLPHGAPTTWVMHRPPTV